MFETRFQLIVLPLGISLKVMILRAMDHAMKSARPPDKETGLFPLDMEDIGFEPMTP